MPMPIDNTNLPNLNQLAHLARAGMNPLEGAKTAKANAPSSKETAEPQQRQKPIEVLKGAAQELGQLCLGGLHIVNGKPQKGAELIAPLLGLCATAADLMGLKRLNTANMIKDESVAALKAISVALFGRVATSQMAKMTPVSTGEKAPATKQDKPMTADDLKKMDKEQLHAVDVNKVPVSVLNEFLSKSGNVKKLSDGQLGELFDKKGITKENQNAVLNAWGGDYKGPKFESPSTAKPIIKQEAPTAPQTAAPKASGDIDSSFIKHGLSLEKMLKSESPSEINAFLKTGGAKQLTANQAYDLLDSSVLSNHALYRKIDQEHISDLMARVDTPRLKLFKMDVMVDLIRNPNFDFEHMSPPLLNHLLDSVGAQDIIPKDVMQKIVDGHSNPGHFLHGQIDVKNLTQLDKWLKS